MTNYDLVQGWQVADKRGQRQNRVPPFAPSANEQKFYIQYINKAANDSNLPRRALILGATPELRDMAIASNFETWAVDISPQMMAKFSTLMDYQGHPLDKQIIGNWLEMDYDPGSFSIVMGDASLNNLTTTANNETLVKICANLLPKNGYFIVRQVLYSDNFKPCGNLEKLISLYRDGQIPWEDFFYELRIIHFKDKVYNPQTYQFNAGECFRLIDGIHADGLLTNSEHARIDVFSNDVQSTYYPEDKFIEMIESHGFRLLETYRDPTCQFFQGMYILIFIKK